jgi:hypothetical protein
MNATTKASVTLLAAWVFMAAFWWAVGLSWVAIAISLVAVTLMPFGIGMSVALLWDNWRK